ncbi:SAV_2336 N-terminal domain-related protein [Streptomyces sp. AC512_CC834]|uniref:SAV_2336 N-terminal domain-related protein n=1 Tax=Streptomyces sp. AC512_CC834 TaxID=2823691 RepID=UPI0020B67C47|nr:SAV_2336 N-terminal domain-related protein [Streptomyces sp. AC512_CC834]
MPTDRPGSPEPLPRLADILGQSASGVRPTPLELAELLWLAGQMEPDAQDPPDGPASGTHPEEPTPPAPEAAPDRDEQRDRDREWDRERERQRRGGQWPGHRPRGDRPADPPPAASDDSRTPLRLPSPAPAPGTSAAQPHSALLAPAPPMLRHTLALQRSLRPLKRRTDAPVGHEVDESATADRIARLGADPRWWLPVLRPVRERWLRLHLVHDAGPTMPVWQPLVRELHAALAESGVFRTVTLHRADPDGTVRGDGAQAPADGRTVMLLISDCMGPQWREGPAGTRWFGTLRRWAHRTPLAVLQPLPEQLWRDTALPPVPGRLSAPHRAAPSASLAFTPYDSTAPRAPGAAVHVPVLEPGPEWLANWAALVASPGGTPYPGAAATLHRPLPADADDRTDVGLLSAEELVLRFRASASPQAYRLAGHLALGRPDLPVMRLVQAAVEPDPRPQHLAEVILSGLLTTVAGPSGSYAFRPGVRDLLLRGLPRTARNRTHELLLRTGGLIDERAGRSPGEFRALFPSREGTERADGSESFAAISQASARQLAARERPALPSPFPAVLGARYRPTRRLAPTGKMWLAEDTTTNRTVAIRLHDADTDPASRRAFLRDARRLTRVTHPNVVTVLDAGVEDDIPYVVMEHLDGIALAALTRPDDRRLPVPLTVSVGAQLARALTALHEAGVTHGGLETSRVVLLPDGTVRLSLLEPGRTTGPPGRSEDLRALCEILLLLTSGTSHLAVPIDSSRLDRSLGAMRIHYAHAFDLMMSASPAAQTQGLRLLTDPKLPPQASAAYPRRRYQALGPLRVTLPDGSPDLPPDVRALLAMLLLKHGRTVTHEELRWGLWDPGNEPRNPRGEVTRLARRLTEILGPGVLATAAHGYALHTSADDLDLVRCDELVRLADAARLEGTLPEAHGLVTEALSLWRDAEPLADVPGPAARTARTRLLRLRLALHTKRAELDLTLGEYDRASAELAGLLRAHPHREDFRRLYLIALRRQGRGEEALEVYEEYELSGGRSPALRALGQELREEHAGPVEDAPPWSEYEHRPEGPDAHEPLVSAPDELPEGPFPTEDDLWAPLLDDDAEHDTAQVPADRDRDGGPEPELEPAEPEPELEEPEPDEREPEELEPDEPELDFDTAFRACVRYALADGPVDHDARAALHGVVTDLLADSGTDEAYELVDEPGGPILVLLAPQAEAAPLLRATVEGLPGRLARLAGLRLRVEFWQVEFRLDGTGEQSLGRADTGSVTAALDASAAQAVVALSDSLYYDEVCEEGQDGPAFPPDLFQPLADDTGWYRLVEDAGDPGAAASDGGAVSGPFPMPADGRLPVGRDASRTFVLRLPDGTLALPDSEPVRSAPPALRAAAQYFEVDLTEHRLETGVGGIEATWQVEDPVEAVRSRATDVREVVAELTREPLAAVREGREFDLGELGEIEVPGYRAVWTLSRPSRPTAPTAPTTPTTPATPSTPAAAAVAPRPRPAAHSPADLIAGARCVLLGFDDVVARLYRPAAEREVLLDIAGLFVEERDPEDALAGVPLPRATTDGYAGTLDFVRALAGHRLAPDVRVRLDRHETRAARTARPVALADRLVRALNTRGVPAAVVSDRAPEPVTAYLRRRGLLDALPGGAHGRGADLARLMPDPDVLHRALERLDAPAGDCVLVGSSAAEQSAARAVGLPFIGHWPGERVRRELTAADPGALLVPDLRPLLTAAENR